MLLHMCVASRSRPGSRLWPAGRCLWDAKFMKMHCRQSGGVCPLADASLEVGVDANNQSVFVHPQLQQANLVAEVAGEVDPQPRVVERELLDGQEARHRVIADEEPCDVVANPGLTVETMSGRWVVDDSISREQGEHALDIESICCSNQRVG